MRRLIALAVALAIGGGAAAQADHYVPGVGSEEAVACYPAADWGPAPDRQRPCVRITRIWEDGSFCAEVTQANGRNHAEVCEGNPRD